MKISGLEKLTLTDYPNHLAAIIFTQGCNFICSFCQNSSLIKCSEGLINECEVLDYLNKRKNVLEGLVISGGEPTIQKDLEEFIVKVKKLGLKVKLDTNGNNYELLKKLIDSKLVDYVAMDIKTIFEEYDSIIGKKINVENIKKSIQLLKNSPIDFEFRTTIIKEFHNEEKIQKIIDYIDGSDYYLQNFQNSSDVIDKSLHGFTDVELKKLARKFNKYKNVKIRGI